MGGIAKGFPLYAPKGRLTRPTPVLLRRKLFDFRQDWREWCFVDLCSGVGTVGLEAWSRGAPLVKLVESSLKVYQYLKKNVEKISISYGEEVADRPLYPLEGTIQRYLDEEKESSGWSKTCWFFDPPYRHKKLYGSVFIEIMDRMGKSDELWIQTGLDSVFQTESKAIKSFIQGDNRLDCYQGEK